MLDRAPVASRFRREIASLQLRSRRTDGAVEPSSINRPCLVPAVKRMFINSRPRGGIEDCNNKGWLCSTKVGTLLWPPTNAISTQCIGAPNSKPHLMVAGRTIVDADVRVASFQPWLDASAVHFLSASTLGRFIVAGNRHALERIHGVPHWEGNPSRTAATHKSNFRSKVRPD